MCIRWHMYDGKIPLLSNLHDGGDEFYHTTDNKDSVPGHQGEKAGKMKSVEKSIFAAQN